jgi:hypothetical protein
MGYCRILALLKGSALALRAVAILKHVGTKAESLNLGLNGTAKSISVCY